jgi:Arc/MetJ family transcription regulator
MTRYTTEIDRALLLEVKEILGTPTLRETVRVAMRNLVEMDETRKKQERDTRRARQAAQRRLKDLLADKP